jgi:transposase-like protein
MEELGLEMRALATTSGLTMMRSIMQAEEESLAGGRGTHGTAINRWCKEKGSVVVGGQRLPVKRQRLRRDGREVALKSYTTFHQNDERSRAIYQRMLSGVSCRNYRKTLEEVAEATGISKSVVSREIIESTEADLKALCERNLSGLEIVVLMVDGMPLDGQMTIAALGVDMSGKKHVLGFREGATENAEVCKNLLGDLAQRGLKMDRPTLAVIDGSKALRKAVEDFYGKNVLVQRCQFHKSENLKKYLTEQYQAEYERKLKTIYGMRSYEDAHHALKGLIEDVQRLSVSAAKSLEEGFEETLTLHRLGLPDVLRKSFSTTNPIESTFSVAETIMRNVKRWRNPMQRMRWCATAFLRAQQQFRRIRGYKSMPVLISAIEAEVRKQKGESISNVA